MNLAKEIIKAADYWQQADKETLTNNILKLLHNNGYDTFTKKWKRLCEITDSGKQTVYAWLNGSRQNVKIPFLKLCMVASEYKVDLYDLLNGGNTYDKPDDKNNSGLEK